MPDHRLTLVFLIVALTVTCNEPQHPRQLLQPPETTTAPARPRAAAYWAPELKDEVLEKIKAQHEEQGEQQVEVTKQIRTRQKAEKKEEKEKDEAFELRAPLPPGPLPTSPGQFTRVFHFEPQPQYHAGTCWAFSATSLLESEIFRITGEKVKLSEMYAVYWEYVEKARRYVHERGDSLFAQGSELNAVTRMWAKYGAVPLSAYPGVLDQEGLHDHKELAERMRHFLEHAKEHDLWDEELVLTVIRQILDHHIGKPPQRFTYKGVVYTPQTFFAKVLTIEPNDYVQLMSTMREPFWQQAEFDVPDNWWRDDSYYNVPLDVFFDSVIGTIKRGFSVGIGGDVSEPGKAYEADIAFIPSFDIPFDYVDQSARQYRIENGSTTDDHGVHLVGWAELGGKFWFLVKDSGRSSRHGNAEGYYFFREDFIKLKMLTTMVHRDAIGEILAKMK